MLGAHGFAPRTSVHCWAVSLDRCKKGHVFLGVATARAGTRTYVGGDRYGWGVIGTRALWHHKFKVPREYGRAFRTGDTISVSLDTDAGTLRFGALTDADDDDGRRPRRSEFTDWGVAFEGLPSDARLYPAVGLYQRDDRVTLMSVRRDKETTRSVTDDGDDRSCRRGVAHAVRLLRSAAASDAVR